MENHPLVEVFPPPTKAEIERLADDIKVNGQLVPVLLHADGRLLDGRARLAACKLLDIEPNFTTWDGRGSLVSLVVGLNVHRRQFDESQRAMVGAMLADMAQGERTDLTPIGGRLSQADAAALLNVGQRTVQKASKIRESGDQDLIEMVLNRLVSVDAASAVAGLPNTERKGIVDAGAKEVKSAARTLRAAARNDRRADTTRTTPHASDAVDAPEQPGADTVVATPEQVEPTVCGTSTVVVAEPHWFIPGITPKFEQTPGAVRAMDAATVKSRIGHVVGDVTDDNGVLLLRVSPYLHEDARKVLEQLRFHHLLDIPVAAGLTASQRGEQDGAGDYVLLGVRGDSAGLDFAALIHWLDERRHAPNPTVLIVNDLARHLSEGPILEVAWTNTEAGGSHG